MKDWLSEMSDREFAKWFADGYRDLMASRKNEDYTVNPPQMNKLRALYRFLRDNYAGMNDRPGDSTVKIVSLVPKEEVGYLEATCYCMSFAGEEVARLCTLLSGCSAVSFEGRLDGRMNLSCTVPDVFVEKEKRE